MPVDGPSYLAGRTDERVLTMFCQVLTIDACGQALKLVRYHRNRYCRIVSTIEAIFSEFSFTITYRSQKPKKNLVFLCAPNNRSKNYSTKFNIRNQQTTPYSFSFRSCGS